LGNNWFADFVFNLDECTFVGGLHHFVGHGVGQHTQIFLFHSRVEHLRFGTVVGDNVDVGVLEFGRLNHGVFVIMESSRQVAEHVVQDDCVVT